RRLADGRGEVVAAEVEGLVEGPRRIDRAGVHRDPARVIVLAVPEGLRPERRPGRTPGDQEHVLLAVRLVPGATDFELLPEPAAGVDVAVLVGGDRRADVLVRVSALARTHCA